MCSPLLKPENSPNTFYERGWAELVVQKDPEFGPKLKEAADRMRKK